MAVYAIATVIATHSLIFFLKAKGMSGMMNISSVANAVDPRADSTRNDDRDIRITVDSR